MITYRFPADVPSTPGLQGNATLRPGSRGARPPLDPTNDRRALGSLVPPPSPWALGSLVPPPPFLIDSVVFGVRTTQRSAAALLRLSDVTTGVTFFQLDLVMAVHMHARGHEGLLGFL